MKQRYDAKTAKSYVNDFMLKTRQDATDTAFIQVLNQFSKNDLWPTEFGGLNIIDCLRFCRQIQDTMHKIKKKKARFQMIQKFCILSAGGIIEDMILKNKPFLNKLIWGQEANDERDNYKHFLARVEDCAEDFILERTN